MWRKHHESLDPVCLVPAVKAAAGVTVITEASQYGPRHTHTHSYEPSGRVTKLKLLQIGFSSATVLHIKISTSQTHSPARGEVSRGFSIEHVQLTCCYR